MSDARGIDGANHSSTLITVSADLAENMVETQAPESSSDEDYSSVRDIAENTVDAVYQQRANDESVLLRELLSNFNDNAVTDRNMRRKVGWALIGFFAVESIFAMALIVMWGIGYVTFPRWVGSIFFTTIFLQVSSLLYLVIKHLFQGAVDQLLLTFIQHRKHD